METLVEHFGNEQSKFMLKHGRSWDPQPLPSEYVHGEQKQCFGNSVMLAIAHDDLTYVEGMALGVLVPVAHAWVVNADGNVIDTTWRDPAACHYFGIPFDTDFVTQIALKRKYFGSLIDDWENGWPLVKGEHGEDWMRKHE